MSIKHRINKLERLSPEKKTHQVRQQDCFVMSNYEPCTPSNCKFGCWMTESEYKSYITNNSVMISEWVGDNN